MYLSLKLSGPVFCVGLGPAHTVPCSVDFGKSGTPGVGLDNSYTQGKGDYLPYAQRSDNGKNISNPRKTGPARLLVNILSPINPPWARCTSRQGLTILQQRKIILLPQQMAVSHQSHPVSEVFFLCLLTFPILINPALIKSSPQATESLYILPI